MTMALRPAQSLVKPMIFVDLHAHTTFSTGDGHGLPKEHVEICKGLGRTHVCFTEHGNVSSWVALEKECAAAGLEPIFGIEAYVSVPDQQRKTHMIILAMNQVGMQNLNRLVTKSWQQFYYYPTMYFDDLEEYSEGLIILSGCADSALNCILLGGKYFGEKRLVASKSDLQRAVRVIERFQKIFGDRYYLEVQRFPGLERTCALNPLLAALSKHTGAQLVATSDVHYPLPEQNAVQRILHASHRGGTVETVDAQWEYDILLTYPRSDLEIFKDLVGTGLSRDEAKLAIENTGTIARRCTGVRLPKAKRAKYVATQSDWESWV